MALAARSPLKYDIGPPRLEVTIAMSSLNSIHEHASGSQYIHQFRCAKFRPGVEKTQPFDDIPVYILVLSRDFRSISR